MTACLSLYTLTPLSNLVSIDGSGDVCVQEDLYSKNGEVWGVNVAEFNTDSILARKQLS